MPESTSRRTFLAAALTGCSSQMEVRPGFHPARCKRRFCQAFLLQGNPGLFNFWATWCGPCKIEIPWFMDFEKTYNNRGFATLGVSMDE